VLTNAGFDDRRSTHTDDIRREGERERERERGRERERKGEGERERESETEREVSDTHVKITDIRCRPHPTANVTDEHAYTSLFRHTRQDN
jgi:hypothetical protein